MNTSRAVSIAVLCPASSFISGTRWMPIYLLNECSPFHAPRNTTQWDVNTMLWYFFVWVGDNSIYNFRIFQQRKISNVWALPRKCIQFSSCLDHFQHVFVSTSPLVCNPPLGIRCSFHTFIACLSWVVSSIKEAPCFYRKTGSCN